MTFNRIVEMAIKPPFKYFIIPVGASPFSGFYFSKNYCFNSLNKAKEKAELLFLKDGDEYSIYNVYYKDGDWEERTGWMSNKIMTLDSDCSWYNEYNSFTIHTSFIRNYDVREWNPKLYDKIRKGFADKILKDEDDWETVKHKLNEIEIDDFKLYVKKACDKVEKKMEAFLKANEELSILVQKKYPKINAQYAIFDRMIMFYEENEIGQIENQFQSLEEVENYYKNKEQ